MGLPDSKRRRKTPQPGFFSAPPLGDPVGGICNGLSKTASPAALALAPALLRFQVPISARHPHLPPIRPHTNVHTSLALCGFDVERQAVAPIWPLGLCLGVACLGSSFGTIFLAGPGRFAAGPQLVLARTGHRASRRPSGSRTGGASAMSLHSVQLCQACPHGLGFPSIRKTRSEGLLADMSLAI